MDIQNNQIQELFEKLYVKNAPSWALERDSDESYKYHATQSAFSLFEQQQAEIELLKSDLAKAQAVPDLSELQERIAGHQYYHDEHGHMVVDMDDVVKEISGFDSWKAQAVPEGYVLVKKVHPDAIVHNQGLGLFKECQVIYGWDGKSKDFKDALNKGFYHGVKLGAKAVLETAMIEAQEPTND